MRAAYVRKAAPAAEGELANGTEVKVRHGGQKDSFPAKIDGCVGPDVYNIKYDDGDYERAVPRFRIQCAGERQKRELEQGWKVDAMCGSGFRSGKIAKVLGGDEYSIAFDHGERQNVARPMICGPFLKPPGA